MVDERRGGIDGLVIAFAVSLITNNISSGTGTYSIVTTAIPVK